MRTLNNAIAYQDYRLSRTDLEKFNEWLSYLHAINHKPRNKQLLFHYFFDKFAFSPHLFYSFLEYFKDHILNLKELTEKKDIAQKHLDIIAPLCERFNFFEERNILNDLSFKILYPEECQETEKLFSKYAKRTERIIQKTLIILNKLLKTKNYDCEVIGRYRNIYSIYQKYKNTRRDLTEINNIFAFRIIVNDNSTTKCFEILNLLHDTFQPIPDLFRDYITIPKVNGYQSLHTGIKKVSKDLDLAIEIQIRTREMHNFDQTGLASHWIGIQGKKSAPMTKNEQQLLSYLSCFAHSAEKENFIYCFSAEGDICKLPHHATVLDFAYYAHPDVNGKIKSALVNNVEKSLYYRIKEGEIIKIIPSTTEQIEEKWLHYAHTKYAYKKVAEYLKNHGKTVKYSFKSRKKYA